MCRLTAFLSPSPNGVHLQRALHIAMLAANAHEGQQDGWGVGALDAEGAPIILSKAGDPYVKSNPDSWQDALRDRLSVTPNILIGHVRKASHTTARSSHASAHPYFLASSKPGGHPFILAHNGFIIGSYSMPKPEGAVVGTGFNNIPDTDTYRAGLYLRVLIDALDEIPETLSTDLLNEWCSDFTTGSSYVFYILYRGELHVIRGVERTMHVIGTHMGVGQGDDAGRYNASSMVLATVAEILEFNQQYILPPAEADFASNILEIPEHTHARFQVTPEGVFASLQPMSVTFKRSATTTYTHVPAATGHTALPARTTPATTSARTQLLLPGADDDEEDGTTRGYDDSPYEEDPFNVALTLRTTSDTHDSRRLSVIRGRINYVTGKLNPMRKQTIAYWAAHYFTHVNTHTGSLVGIRRTVDKPVSLEQIALHVGLDSFTIFIRYALSLSGARADDDLNIFPSVEVQEFQHKYFKRVMTEWNRAFKPDQESEIIAPFIWEYGCLPWIWRANFTRMFTSSLDASTESSWYGDAMKAFQQSLTTECSPEPEQLQVLFDSYRAEYFQPKKEA